jgi:hypothetical protein
MKALARFGLFLLILSPLAFLLVSDPVRRAPDPRPSPSPRKAEFRVCPGVAVRSVPRGLGLVRRELRNLGQNVMGRSIQFGGRGQRVWVAVGFDVLDSLEDLDFTEESVESVGSRRVNITTTDIISAHRIRAGAWQDERFEPPCDEFTVVAWNLTEKTFLDVLGGVRVVYGESRHGGIG